MNKLLLPLLLVYAGAAHASDGAQSLREALARFKNQSPVKAQLQVRGETKGEDETGPSSAQLQVEDGPQGLRLSYPQAVLAQAQQEELAKDRDPKAQTPTVAGLRQLDLADARDMLRAADGLQRRLARASFKGEKAEVWQGQPARKLTFELENLRPHKYVKDYSGQLDVWVNEQGQPLASRAVQKVSGRAYVVISFDMSNEDETVYQVSGDRLVATRRVTKGQGSGAGEKGSSNKTLTLSIS
jgi:hypothetical protein